MRCGRSSDRGFLPGSAGSNLVLLMVGLRADLDRLRSGNMSFSSPWLPHSSPPHLCRSWSTEAILMVHSRQLPCINLMETDLPVGQHLVSLEAVSCRSTLPIPVGAVALMAL